MYCNHPLQVQSVNGISIAAGVYSAVTKCTVHSIDLNQLLIPRAISTFPFRITGEQGIAQGIYYGDIAMVDRAIKPRPVDLVLWHDGQRFNVSCSVRVQPNSDIWGVITAVIHQYRNENS